MGNLNIDHQLMLLEAEKESAIHAAARMANALTDLFNDVGEIPEVRKCFESVERDIDSYKGQEEY